jgi:nucleoside-diphosphate-sugar epimerase
MKKISLLNKKILVLGSTGLIGSALVDSLEEKGCKVWGASLVSRGTATKYHQLDLSRLEQIRRFPWGKYDIIFNCAGIVDYRNVLSAAVSNLDLNALAPLRIIQELKKNQVYYHCSTHVATLPISKHNSYSLSKSVFEQFLQKITDVRPTVVILKIPGVFDERRKSGIANLIKTSFQNKRPLTINWQAENWHTMYLPRLMKVILALLKNDCRESVVPIGYGPEQTVEQLVMTARQVFGYDIPISIPTNITNHYRVNINAQKRYIRLTGKDFKNDLSLYFQNP